MNPIEVVAMLLAWVCLLFVVGAALVALALPLALLSSMLISLLEHFFGASHADPN